MGDEISAAIKARADRAIAEKVFPGCVIGTVDTKGERRVIPVGTIIYDSAESVREDTIYDLASITKSIPIASLALTIMQEEPTRLNLVGKVVDYLPELQNDYGATIEDLLRYRVTGARMSELKLKTFEEIRTHVLERGFNRPPEKEEYTNLPAFLLGLILERVTGKILPVLAHKYFFEPLGMNDTTFFPHDINRIAPTEIVDDKEIKGIVHDESARIFARARRAVGHAGLFSTVPDLLNFLGAIITAHHNTDDYSNVLKNMRIVADGAQSGLGWEANREWMGSSRTQTTFGKTGFTGTSVLCDTGKGIGLVILSNRTYPKRPPDNSAINSFRADISDIVLA